MLSLLLPDIVAVLFPLFGGCCLNVFALENLLLDSPVPLGTVVTFSQFVFIAAVAFPSQTSFQYSSWKRLWLMPSKIPLFSWLYYVLMFFTVSLLNNLVLRFNISIPLHTIFRSSATVITMSIGYLFGGKRYNRHQVFSCLAMTSGAILATFRPSSGPSQAVDSQFVLGIFLLVTLSVLASFMSLYNESLVAMHGNQWQESLFYTHFLGLPLFLVVGSGLKSELLAIWNDPKVYEIGDFRISKQITNLIVNVSSQYMCIRSVSKLAGKTSALTVSIVLLVRKFTSLLLSVLWFGNEIGPNGATGAVLVFAGTIYYILASRPKVAPGKNKKAKRKEEVQLSKTKETKKSKETEGSRALRKRVPEAAR